MVKFLFSLVYQWLSQGSLRVSVSSSPSNPHRVLENRALVLVAICPGGRGRVQFQATSWFAVCLDNVHLLPDMPVRVVEQYDATTLIVEPV